MKFTLSFFFLLLFVVTFILMLFIPIFSGRLLSNPIQIDELQYQKIVDRWNQKGTNALIELKDNKPLAFLYLQKILDGDYNKTRVLNLIFIALNTFLIFYMTRRYESFLYPIIPFFLNSMWLTVEIMETFFILLSFIIARYQGLFVGLAALFRPYAAIFTLLETRTQQAYTLTIGILFAGYLYFSGLLFFYLDTVLKYGTGGATGQDFLALMFLFPMAMICIRNKEMFKYGIFACIPLIIRMWAHYFITPYSLFFLGYLQTKTIK